MSDDPLPPPRPPSWGPRPEGPPALRAPGPKRPRRVFLWVFLALQLLFLVWVIAGLNNADDDPASCAGLTGDELQLCRDAGDVGSVIGLSLLIALWAAVDVILGITYGIYRLSRRQRP
ncbi:hypothetical protein [Streptomyces sp. NPDC054787]